MSFNNDTRPPFVESLTIRVNHEKNACKKPPPFLPQLPEQAQLAKREASTHSLAIPPSSILGLKIAFLDKKIIFSTNIELAGIARQSIEASRLDS